MNIVMDRNLVLNNIGFNTTMNNGAGGAGNDPAICIRHLSHNWTNNHTTTMNNGADEFMVNGSNNGCLYPIVGYASNNIQGPVEPQLIDPNNFDFRPKPGSDYDKQYVGPYLSNDTFYWIPGRKTNQPSFPIPRDGGILRLRCDGDDGKYFELMWRMGYESRYHIGWIWDDKGGLIEKKEFFEKRNIWKIRHVDVLNNFGLYYWRVDSIVDNNTKYEGNRWKFLLIDECV